MGIGRLRCHVIDVDDLAVAEAFWSEVTGLPVIPSGFPGRYSYLGQADPWRHEVILHLVKTRKGPEANRSHVDIWVRDIDTAIARSRPSAARSRRRRASTRGRGPIPASRPDRLGGDAGPVRQRVLPGHRALGRGGQRDRGGLRAARAR